MVKFVVGVTALLAAQATAFAPVVQPQLTRADVMLSMAAEGQPKSKRARALKRLGKIAGGIVGGAFAITGATPPAFAAASAVKEATDTTNLVKLGAGIGAGAVAAGAAVGTVISGGKTPAPTPAPITPAPKVEWSVEKGAKTFGLSLDVVPGTAPFPLASRAYPGAVPNSELVGIVNAALEAAGYDKDKTLVACSLCCDEVNRPLEKDLSDVYTQNFNMGGLAGFPFGGSVSFGAMTAHIPDGGNTLVVYGPHVGVDSTGAIGTVERRGRKNGGACCGSAVAASGYVSGVYNGGDKMTIPDDAFDAQQAMVSEMLLPYAERLEKAENKMKELPLALYDAQTEMMKEIVGGGMGPDGNIAVLGGIQINTPPEYSDYFLPLSFELYNNKGKLIDDIMPSIVQRPFPKVQELFPGALTNAELVDKVTNTVKEAGFDESKSLVATSLCCDEVNRPLENDLSAIFDTNFNMGGLAGFPFGGATSFGAMASHIPDGGDCLVVYGPHVGVDTTGAAGTVERRGKANGGSCCGSAVAASGYVDSVYKGDAEKASLPSAIVDTQQYFVGKMLLPYAKQLDIAENKMVELPYALYDAQKDLMTRIVTEKASAVANGNTAVLGGIQINTPEGYSDYYLPLSFELYNNKGKVVKTLWE